MALQDILRLVQKNISKAAQEAGRDPDTLHIIAVTKTLSAEKIQEALNAGLRLFGENRVQEAQQHWQDMKAQYPDIRLHLIGPLQTNKVKAAVALFDEIQTIDRKELVEVLSSEMKKQGRYPALWVQVNVGEEPQKAGVLPQNLAAFLQYCKDRELKIKGLMCIPPVEEPAGLYFAFLKTLAQRYNLPHLSMGMSGDYEQAVQSGATHIRLGSILFGNRI